MLVDPAIRDWVLLPLLALALIVHYARTYLLAVIMTPAVMGAVEAAQRAIVARSQRLRAYGGFISHAGFQARKRYFAGLPGAPGATVADADKGLLRRPQPAGAPALNPMMDPGAQMNMMKQQVVFMASNLGIIYWVGSFFTGFLALKLPFSLTERFKALTQAGILVPGLDTGFVSSQSWFATAQFGLPALARLFTGGGDDDSTSAAMMQMQMGMMPGMPGAPGAPGQQGWQPKQAYEAEAAALDGARWNPSVLLLAERELLEEAQRNGLGDTAAGRAAIAGAAAAADSKKQR